MPHRFAYILLGVVLLATGCHSSIPPHTRRIITPPVNKLGIHLLLDDGRNHWPVELWPEHLDYARQVVGEWGFVVQLIRQDDFDETKWQLFMNLCAERQITPIVRLATTFDPSQGWWVAPPQDRDGGYGEIAAATATFLTALHWPTGEHLIIVGNEPNHGDEWGGRANPTEYARYLRDMAAALHATDPDARILNAPLDPFTPHTGAGTLNGMGYLDAESFMDGMIAAVPDIFTHLDAWASHPYPLGPFREAPWEQQHQVDFLNDASNPNQLTPLENIYNRGINGYAWELFKLASYGVDRLPVFITETGWKHAETVDPDSTDHQEALPDAETVALYFDLTLNGNRGRVPELPDTGWTPWLDDAHVYAIAPFALNGHPAEWGHTNWLILDERGRVLATYPPFELFNQLTR
ncbi:MAG: hypothetical protein KJ063_10600 [Anaerolineae bacterium]|nr:hypothetical protein [Anaerolineae bacterium]